MAKRFHAAMHFDQPVDEVFAAQSDPHYVVWKHEHMAAFEVSASTEEVGDHVVVSSSRRLPAEIPPRWPSGSVGESILVEEVHDWVADRRGRVAARRSRHGLFGPARCRWTEPSIYAPTTGGAGWRSSSTRRRTCPSWAGSWKSSRRPVHAGAPVEERSPPWYEQRRIPGQKRNNRSEKGPTRGRSERASAPPPG